MSQQSSKTLPVLTLGRAHSPLAAPDAQKRILEQSQVADFQSTLVERGLPRLQADSVRTLQINVGKVCNQTCNHCHVDAGPDRRETMSRETAAACIDALRASEIETLDITGGAPEMNPRFRWLVEQARALERHVIDRCNLTILTAPGFRDLPEFLARQQVEIIASLPCYLEENCDRQRGTGVFKRSLEGIRRLNALGYGQSGTGLELSLVYNPQGTSLPPDQFQLESAYREQLRSQHGVEFTRLYTITNMPISRFLDDLLQSGRYEDYMQKLVNAFNPAAVENLMCRSMISVDWRGNLYDCDFNQMLDLPVSSMSARHIRDWASGKLNQRPIVTGSHCYGCTAGAGSSCGGALAGQS